MTKIRIFILSLIFLSACKVVNAQNLPSGSYSFSFKKIKLIDALEQIKQKTELNFTYSSDNLSLDELITFEVTDEKLEDVFDKLFNKHQLKWTLVGNQVALKQQNKKITISGYITEKGSKEVLPGAMIYIPKLKSGITTNSYGFYSITLPEDSIELIFSYVGFKSKKISLYNNKPQSINIEMSAEELAEVTVTAEQSKKVSDEAQMSSIDIPIEQIKQIPALLGEKDVLKVIQLMPGVQKGGEGNAGIYVRGGGPDQNLILLDEATVYNANHLFGFFSVFNGDAIKSVELIKGGFPARYGGRLSSVIDLQMKDGNKEQFHGEAGIGIISSRLTLEGPLKKNKSSFLVTGRRTYIDALIYPFLPAQKKGGYYFYDFNAKLNYFLNDKDRLFLSGYFGKDKFYLKSKLDDYSEMKGNLNWGNATATLRWNHLFSSRLFSNASVIFTKYQFGINQTSKIDQDSYTLDYRSNIRDLGIKYNFDFMPVPKHYIRFGLNGVWHHFVPQAVVFKSSALGQAIEGKPLETFESGLFIEDDWKVTQRLRMNVGFRLSGFLSNKDFFVQPEPRASMRYLLRNDFSLKGSYALMNQYMHLLSNTGIGLPTDLWVPATNKVKPQQSQQVALGLAKDLTDKNLTITVEGYYKWMENVLNYKEGASFMALNSSGASGSNAVDWQNNVVAGKGWSYGGELFIQRKAGRFTGWIGYTLSWTWLQYDSLNFGEKFHPRYDRRNDISLVGIYKLNEKITFSATWVYGTGNAITLPLADYIAEVNTSASSVISILPNEKEISDYGKKNGSRMSPYHRLDIGIRHTKKLKRYERIFEFSVYNAYNRANPFFYYTTYDKSKNTTKLMQTSIFPIIPSVSWTFKF